jgi:hypothetical protein
VINEEGSMKRKFVLAVVLCLAVAAALAIGAAPALAADGCDCHTAVPPTGGAPAAHSPYVPGVTACVTCHKGMTVPHPELVEPALWGYLATDPIIGRPVTGGSLHIPWVPLGGVTVYVQGKPAGASAYTDLGHFRTHRDGYFRAVLKKGSIADDMTFRAISEGLAGPPLVLPALNGPRVVELPTATVTWRLRGPSDGVLSLGKSVTATAKVSPADLTGRRPMFEVHRRIAGHWRWLLTVTRTLSATGTYSWTWTPRHRGQYKMFALVGSTAAYDGSATGFRRFRVK